MTDQTISKRFSADEVDAILAREAKRLLRAEREDWFACLDSATVEVRRPGAAGAVVRFMVMENAEATT